MSSEDTDRDSGWFMMNDTKRAMAIDKLCLLCHQETSGFYPLHSSNVFHRESNLKGFFVDSAAII